MKSNTIEYDSSDFEQIKPLLEDPIKTPQTNSFLGEPQRAEVLITSPPSSSVVKPKPLVNYETPNYLPKPQDLGTFPNIPNYPKSNFWKSYAVGIVILLTLAVSYLVYKTENGGIITQENESLNISNNYEIQLNPSISSPITNNQDYKYNNTFQNEFNFQFDLSEQMINRICNSS